MRSPKTSMRYAHLGNRRAVRRQTAFRVVLFAATIGFGKPADAAIELQLVANNVPHVIGIEHAGDGSGRLFLVSQSGRILIYNGTAVLSTPFLDITSLVTVGAEQGLLGLAFHPNYSSNGRFFIHYTNTSNQTVIARYQVSGDPNVANPGSATILLTENQPFTNHKGGQISFGPDGFLYIALGDGGSGGDPQNHGQRLNTVLGKLLRIDVNSGSPYGIPPSNPFVSTTGARGEIWAYGLRNPWRFSFDRQTGDLFIADVGQNLWEEANFRAAASTGGENYGWRLMEGFHCYDPSAGCDPSGSLTRPIVEYYHSLGCSITGGFRYRGTVLTAHVGTYFFADYCTGRIWGGTRNGDGTWTATQLLDTNLLITTFGQDADGTLYLANYGANGQLYRIVPGTSSSYLLTVTKSGAGSGRITSSPIALDCGSVCAAQLAAGTGIGLIATPDAGWTFVGWSGHPDCADGNVTLSGDRTCTATFGTSFTDNTLAAGSTVIKAVHITELRTRINGIRINRGLSQFAWTDSTLTPGSTLVKTVHVTEMRTALNEAYAAAGQTARTYTDPVLAPGQVVKAVHISELRAAVLALE